MHLSGPVLEFNTYTSIGLSKAPQMVIALPCGFPLTKHTHCEPPKEKANTHTPSKKGHHSFGWLFRCFSACLALVLACCAVCRSLAIEVTRSRQRSWTPELFPANGSVLFRVSRPGKKGPGVLWQFGEPWRLLACGLGK